MKSGVEKADSAEIETIAACGDFEEELFCALRVLAVRSPRAQADLQAALFRAGLQATPEAIAIALARLVERGLVRDVIHLRDGGVLVTVWLAIS